MAAAYFRVYNVQTFSGGTEVAAFNAKAVAAIKRAGFSVTYSDGENPLYRVKYAKNDAPLQCFSKKFNHAINPKNAFAAILTCSNAEQNCPVVEGAEFRISIMYQDPKVADKTINETTIYDQRCQQIATEMLYLFSKV